MKTTIIPVVCATLCCAAWCGFAETADVTVLAKSPVSGVRSASRQVVEGAKVAAIQARSVTEEEVAAARASCPKSDDRAVANRIGADRMGRWVTDGQVPGKVIFADDFADGTFTANWVDRYARKGDIRVVDDGRGGKCLLIQPREKDFNCLELKADRYIPVDPSHPIAVLWETRASQGGNTPMLRIDYYDENRKSVRGEYQFRTNVDPTQPTLFLRNAHLVSLKMPVRTKFLRLTFHHCPKATDEFPGEISNVRVVDLTDEVVAELAQQEPVRAERRQASASQVLVYAADNLTASYPVMPDSAAVPGRAGDTLRVRECPGEKTRTTAILWSKSDWPDVTVEFPALACAEGARLSADVFSAKVVKCHYQGEGAPSGFVAISERQVLVPELLLNDDSLVVADHGQNRNLVRLDGADARGYVDINTLALPSWDYPLPAEQLPIKDAKALCPFDIAAGQNKQLAIRLAVPKDATPGRYVGEIEFKSCGQAIAKLPVELEVLPFELPAEAETVYDATRRYSMGLYVWARPSKDGRAYIAPFLRSEKQVIDEWRTLVDCGITEPTFIWDSSIVFDDARFRLHLALVRQAGFPGHTLHLGASGLIGNATEQEKLSAKQRELMRAMAVAKEYGFDEVYFYGFDEAKGDRLLSQIPAWKAARAVGAKVMVSGYSQHFKLVGEDLDLCVYADDPGSANPADWHSKGGRLWKYNTPQAGPEDPGIFRRNYGLDIWKRGFDGANTYCDVGSSACWNDIAGLQKLRREKKNGSAYRGLCILYPTADGVIETLALTGLESAIKDVRVLTKFRQLLRAHPNPEAKVWFDGLKPEVDDLVRVRREAIDWILALCR